MKYWIFIDESGSINKHKFGFFSISLLLISNDLLKKTKNDFQRTIRPLVNKYNGDNKPEFKAHFLKSNNLLSYLGKSITRCVNEYNNYICCYISNIELNDKWLVDKGSTYNFMIKAAIERAISLKLLNKDDELEILSDSFTCSRKYIGSLQTYLRTEFIINQTVFKSINHNFIDSKKHWGIQLVDYLSFSNHRKITKNNIQEKENFRRVY